LILTTKQRNDLSARLDGIWAKNKVCPIRDAFDWNASERLMAMHEYRGGPADGRAEAVVPLVAVTCNACGHMVIFNALAMGIVLRSTGGNASA
jgi:hypothetical protein